MKDVFLTPEGAKRVMRPMIVSCGTSGCFEAIKRLEAVTEPVRLTEIGTDAGGNWLMAVFSRLAEYAAEENLDLLDAFEVVRYFAGKKHIEIMERIADHAGMGQYLGPQAGLVTHVLLPLQEGEYRNGDLRVSFGGQWLELNPGEDGVPCYHLGVVVNIPLTPEQVAKILAEQASQEAFVRAVKALKGPVIPPPEYLEALSCTVRKASA